MSRTSRRGLIVGAAGIGATAAVTGCDRTDNKGSAATKGGADPSPVAPAPENRGPDLLGITDEVPVGGGKVYGAQKVVVTQPAPGDFRAFSAICTHQGCTVSSVKDGMIVCPCHGSRFSVVDGAPKSGPATRPLPVKLVTVDGNELRVLET